MSANLFRSRVHLGSAWPSLLKESENIPHVLPAVVRYVDDLVLVDGHSSDGTVAVARRSIQTSEWSNSLSRQRRRGDKWLRCGTGDIIVMLYADCSTDPGEILVSSARLTSRKDRGSSKAEAPLRGLARQS
jgi:hypothetical protein